MGRIFSLQELSRSINVEKPPLSQVWSRCPRLTFIRLHYTYFIITCLISSAIFWTASTVNSIQYADSLFLVVAAMTQAGLNPVNLSTLSTFQQVMIFLLIIFGNQIFISALVIHVRKRAFERRFSQKKRKKQAERQLLSSIPPRVSLQNHEIDRDTQRGTEAYYRPSITIRCREQHDHTPIHGTVDRNAQFHGLSPEEREHVQCVEYHAVRLLGYLVPAYSIVWQVFGCTALGAFIAQRQPKATAVNDLNPWWVGTFFGVAAFNNAGMSLLDLSAIPFQNSAYALITMILLTLAGNTAYPVFLRLYLWVGLKLLPKTDQFQSWRDTIQFILKYPRRVYTNLFPSTATWWLVLMIIFFNAIDWAAFEALNWHNPVVRSIPIGYRLLDGLFQAFAVRSSGFAVVSISSLAVGLQALYLMMMYISAFPVTITMRNSNVYEERSLGIFAEDLPTKRPVETSSVLIRHDRLYFIREQLQRQLGHDIWFLVICMILITILETPSYTRDSSTFALFNIIFEIVSAYGCVGLSIGLPDQAYSFCGRWHVASKVILCVVMLRGRHRGLPVEIDRAIQLPGEEEEEREREIWIREETARARERRSRERIVV